MMREKTQEKTLHQNTEYNTFMKLIEGDNPVLHKVTPKRYREFINNIKHKGISVENNLRVYHLRKKIGSVYVELERVPLDEVDHFTQYDMNMGLEPEYVRTYGDDVIACYGWIEDLDGKKYYYLNRDLYPTWFNDNVIHI